MAKFYILGAAARLGAAVFAWSSLKKANLLAYARDEYGQSQSPDEQIAQLESDRPNLARRIGAKINLPFFHDWDGRAPMEKTNVAVYMFVTPCEVNLDGMPSGDLRGFYLLTKLERRINELSKRFLKIHNVTSLELIAGPELDCEATASYLHQYLIDHKNERGTFRLIQVPDLRDAVLEAHDPPVCGVPPPLPGRKRGFENSFRRYMHRPWHPATLQPGSGHPHLMSDNKEVTALKVIVCGPNFHRFFLTCLLQLDPSHWNRMSTPAAGIISMVTVDGWGCPKLICYAHDPMDT